MKKKISIAFIIYIFLIFFQPLNYLKAQEEVKEIKNLITIVEMRIEKVKNSDAENFALEEINIIEDYIKETKRLVSEEKYKKAYYVVSIAISYFNLIRAKSFLNESKEKLKRVKENLND